MHRCVLQAYDLSYMCIKCMHPLMPTAQCAATRSTLACIRYAAGRILNDARGSFILYGFTETPSIWFCLPFMPMQSNGRSMCELNMMASTERLTLSITALN
eukprot:TRINITY_DN5731_c0_g1_i1.p1 TRINITY_DN5731_c0_g1~~TRINITY_DN5731_c0_g1_i1.p1  ORF type:complete len:101 (-),score=1.44 TRINITY_DN5731_c0_g1_i1:264-566(-)